MAEAASGGGGGGGTSRAALDAYFQRAVGMIPPALYTHRQKALDAREAQQAAASGGGKYLRHSRKVALPKEIKRQRNMQEKRRKFGAPSEEEEEEDTDGDDDDDDDDDYEQEQEEDQEEADAVAVRITHKRTTTTTTVARATATIPTPATAGTSGEEEVGASVTGDVIAELKRRLAAKVEAARQKRKADAHGKKDRAALRAEARGKKGRQDRLKQKQKQQQQQQRAGTKRKAPEPSDEDGGDGQSISGVSNTLPDSSLSLDVDFSQVLIDDQKPGRSKGPAGGKPGSKTKRLQHLLRTAEEKQKRMEELKRQVREGRSRGQGSSSSASADAPASSEDAADALSKMQWRDVQRAAAGEKVMDNPALLRKALKKREKAKAKSAREWKARLSAVDEAKQERQQKRAENLEQPRKKKRRAGFEGKRDSFLNSET